MLNLINQTDSIITVFNSKFYKNVERGATLTVTDEMIGGDMTLSVKDLSMNAERIEDNIQTNREGKRFSWRFVRESSFPCISTISVEGASEVKVTNADWRFVPMYKLLRVKLSLCYFDFVVDGAEVKATENSYIDKVDRTSILRSLIIELVLVGALTLFMLFASVSAIIEAILWPIMIAVFLITAALIYDTVRLVMTLRLNLSRKVKDYPQYKSRFDV